MPEWGIAACVGGLCSLLRMHSNKWWCWRVWFHVLVVVVLDAAVAVMLLPFLRIMHLPSAIPTYWHVVVAGVLAPAVIRTRTPDELGFLGRKRFLGPIREIQEGSESAMEEIRRESQRTWLNEALDKVSEVSVEEVRNWAVQYLGGVDRYREKVNLAWATAAEDSSTEEKRKRVILQVLFDAGSARGVRKLLDHVRSASPAPLLRRRWFDRKLSAERLCQRLVVPPGFRKDLVHGRVRIGYPDRHVDELLCRLAQRIATELAGVVRVEGVYEGWITVSVPLKAHEVKRYSRVVSWLVESLTSCAVGLHAVVQCNCIVRDEQTGLYAEASLVVSTVGPDEPPLLVAEVVVGPCAVPDGRTYKKAMHCRAGVPIYVVLDLPNSEILVYSDPGNNDYRSEQPLRPGDPVRLPHPLNLSLDTTPLLALQLNA